MTAIGDNNLDRLLDGGRRRLFLHELLTNAVHFPLANIFMELLTDPTDAYLLEIDPYVILFSALAQAWVASTWQGLGRPRPLVANLIGPAVYTLIEVGVEGIAPFATANHAAYWLFALAVGLLQQSRLALPGLFGRGLVLAEHVVRTSIPLVMYAILEAQDVAYTSVSDFLGDASHVFVVAVMPLLGLVVGFASLTAETYLQALRRTAGQLREYSEWLLGRDLLSRAVADPQALAPRRCERAILFTDIRGFTAWSEVRTPEQVARLVNAFYGTAEPVWNRFGAIKVKLTADEIMLVFADGVAAVRAAAALREAVRPLLAAHGLAAGTGVHVGEVVEGLMGARDRKLFDVLGDTVNTAKRLCDAAGPDEILLSERAQEGFADGSLAGPARDVRAKGKAQPLYARPLPLPAAGYTARRGG